MMKKLIFILDVDGVMTTGQFLYSQDGKAYKIFGPHDNDGLKLLNDKVTIQFITADKRGFPISKKRIIDDMLGPNGLIVSLDNKTLYVADSLQKLWNAYPVKPDGTVGRGKLFYKSGDEGSGSDPGDLPDGMTIDPLGNVYLTGLGGVRIVSPRGQLLWMINIPEKASNVTLGGKKGNTLFITCNKKVYGFHLNL